MIFEQLVSLFFSLGDDSTCDNFLILGLILVLF